MRENLYERSEFPFFTILMVMILIVGTWDGIQGLVHKVHETIEVHEINLNIPQTFFSSSITPSRTL